MRSCESTISGRSGFTLVELLISLVIFLIVGQMMVQSFGLQAKFRRDVEVRSEMDQGLKAALDEITRDVRIAGACLPKQPLFVPIAGANNGTTDTLTVRTGLVTANTTCPSTRLSSALNGGGTVLSVDDVSGFTVDGMGYLAQGSLAGEFFHVTAVSGTSGAGTITTDSTISQNHIAGSGVWALEQRTYSVGTTNGQPALFRQINTQAATPIALGITALDIRYRQNVNCPSCTEVDLPADNPAWNQVTEVLVTVSAQASATMIGSTARLTQSATVAVQPRNVIALRSS